MNDQAIIMGGQAALHYYSQKGNIAIGAPQRRNSSFSQWWVVKFETSDVKMGSGASHKRTWTHGGRAAGLSGWKRAGEPGWSERRGREREDSTSTSRFLLVSVLVQGSSHWSRTDSIKLMCYADYTSQKGNMSFPLYQLFT